jgi:hypothetical protein
VIDPEGWYDFTEFANQPPRLYYVPVKPAKNPRADEYRPLPPQYAHFIFWDKSRLDDDGFCKVHWAVYNIPNAGLDPTKGEAVVAYEPPSEDDIPRYYAVSVYFGRERMNTRLLPGAMLYFSKGVANHVLQFVVANGCTEAACKKMVRIRKQPGEIERRKLRKKEKKAKEEEEREKTIKEKIRENRREMNREKRRREIEKMMEKRKERTVEEERRERLEKTGERVKQGRSKVFFRRLAQI